MIHIPDQPVITKRGALPLTETLEAVDLFSSFSKPTQTVAIALYCGLRRLPIVRFYHLQSLYLGGEK